MALIPVGAILYVGAVQLGAGSLKDLALALFVGMAAGAYSSIFIATPLLVHLKSRSPRSCWPRSAPRPAPRHEADRYASVPVFTDDLPVAGRARRDPAEDLDDDAASTPPAHGRPGAGPAARHRGRRPRSGRPRAARTGGAEQRRPGRAQPHPADPLQARQEVTADPAVLAAAGRRSSAWSLDVPDFPEPGIVFKDITPLLADHAASPPWSTALADGRPRRRRRRRSSTRSSAWRPAASSSARPSRWPSGSASCRSARPASCPATTHAVSYALEYGEATLELHRDAIAPGERVLLVDDVLATGGTVAATRELVERAAASPRRRRADGARLPARARHRRATCR